MRQILWKRLDVPGHDAASLRLGPAGAVIEGTAVFLEGAPTALGYSVTCDRAWQATEAVVRGWRGNRSIELRASRRAGDTWALNDVPCPAVAGCRDLDLGFTPATNLIALRRLGLDVGRSAELVSAWLEWPEARLAPLRQRYTRRSLTEYGYEADPPGAPAYRAVLRVEPEGWVLDYAGLWQVELPPEPVRS
jgi:hypothetical protein